MVEARLVARLNALKDKLQVFYDIGFTYLETYIFAQLISSVRKKGENVWKHAYLLFVTDP